VSKNEIILGVAALILVVFSLVVALVIPRRNPDFPGDRGGLFALVAVLLVAGMLGVVEVYGAEHEGGGAAAAHEEDDDGEAQVEGGEGGEGGESGTGGGGGGSGAEGDAANGEGLFADQGCGSCHVLEAAGSEGAVGPNLDDAQPSFEETVKQVTEGGGGMPAFGDKLSEDEIADVSAYVVESTQG
jgi:mono/diheme cytochrome c family protein